MQVTLGPQTAVFWQIAFDFEPQPPHFSTGAQLVDVSALGFDVHVVVQDDLAGLLNEHKLNFCPVLHPLSMTRTSNGSHAGLAFKRGKTIRDIP